MLPNFLVIGAPRAGTTWIDQNLRAHPDIFMPPEKELHFFDSHYEKGLDYYESMFTGWRGEAAVGEATPAYLHGQTSKNDIPALLHRHLPNARLIVSLRNPVDRAYSRYLNSLAKHDSSVWGSFEEKLIHRPEFIREGYYADQLENFQTYFPRSQILVLFYEDLLSDPVEFMRSIYSFLQVATDFTPPVAGFHVNSALGKRSLARSKLLWAASRILWHTRLHGLSEKLRIWNSAQPAPLSAEMRRQLVAIYAEHNRRLEALTGRDLDAWNRLD